MGSGMSFDGVAPFYRGMERFLAGGILQKARTCHFDRLQAARSILIVGEGIGRSLEVLIPQAPLADITVVEASGGMIEVAHKRLQKGNLPTARVCWHQADIRSWDIAARSFDAVITPFVLDCFIRDDVDAVVSHIAGSVTPGGQWLHADFQIPPHGWRRARARLIHALMYRTFRTLVHLESREATPVAPYLQRSGFQLEAQAEFCARLIRSEVWRAP